MEFFSCIDTDCYYTEMQWLMKSEKLGNEQGLNPGSSGYYTNGLTH